MQLGLIVNVNDGQVEKIDPLLTLLNNYVGYLKENSLEVIDTIFQPLFQKIKEIGVPIDNTSEIQKLQIKVTTEFFRLMQKVCSEFTPSVFLQQKNLQPFHEFIMLVFDHLQQGCDQNSKKIIVTMLKTL